MKIAIVTGASSGLGRKYVKAVAENYDALDEIWIIARRAEVLGKIAEEYSNVKITPLALDLADSSSVGLLEKKLKAENPDVRILINNAGYEKTGRLDEMKYSFITNMIDLNVRGLTLVDRACFPYMSKGAFAIHTCSVSSFCPVPGQAVYSATKSYVKAISRSLREEMLKKGVNVLMMCPGNMDTEMNPKGQKSQSKTVDALPFLDMDVITVKSLKKAEQGKAIYTPGGFYKVYRVLGKILPTALMIKFVRKSYDY